LSVDDRNDGLGTNGSGDARRESTEKQKKGTKLQHGENNKERNGNKPGVTHTAGEEVYMIEGGGRPVDIFGSLSICCNLRWSHAKGTTAVSSDGFEAARDMQDCLI
jgi:hypothetical protein